MKKKIDQASLRLETTRIKKPVARNGLTLDELEHIEEAAHHSQTSEARSILRVAAALREALQMKENACALCGFKNQPGGDSSKGAK